LILAFAWIFLAAAGSTANGVVIIPRTPRAGEAVAVILRNRDSAPPGCFSASGRRAICIVGVPVDATREHTIEAGGERVIVKLAPRRDRKGHVVFRVRTPKEPIVAQGSDAGSSLSTLDSQLSTTSNAGAAPGSAESSVPLSGRDAIRAATSVSAPERLWSAPFEWPAQGGGHSFGVVRSYVRYRDGKLEKRWQGRHLGVDIGARRGSSVRAANDGRVVLTGHFFGTGRCVYLDHGLGLFSMYFHLDTIDVKMGDAVKRGQTLGRVGSTGSSTAPHLHWEARIGRTSIDPARLIPLTRKLAKLRSKPKTLNPRRGNAR
jgi:murein DD-endopeptidase MepM/ murein hydrolase activator NlpD